jgi:hypothetical protein
LIDTCFAAHLVNTIREILLRLSWDWLHPGRNHLCAMRFYGHSRIVRLWRVASEGKRCNHDKD